MDNLKRVIEQAAVKQGGKTALAKYLGIARTSIPDVLAGKRGLPPFAQAKLEELMGLKSGILRAPSELVIEKDPQRKSFWEKLVALEAAAWEVADTPVVVFSQKKKVKKDGK